MIRVEAVHTFPGSLSEVFAYVTDLANWHEYWPGFVRIEDRASARWQQPGDEVTVVLRVLNRDRAMHMELDEFRPDAFVAYRTHMDGLPDGQHERHFAESSGGVEYRGVVAYEPRGGLRGLYDRFVTKRAIGRTLRSTIRNLETRLQPGPPS